MTFLETNDPEVMQARRNDLDTMIRENKVFIDKLIAEGKNTIPLRIVEDRLVIEDQLLKIAILELEGNLWKS